MLSVKFYEEFYVLLRTELGRLISLLQINIILPISYHFISSKSFINPIYLFPWLSNLVS